MFSRHVNQQLSAYHHGELAPAEARRVAEHLLQCQRCRAEYDEIKFGAQLAQTLMRAQAPADLWPAVLNQLEQQLDASARSDKTAGWLNWRWPQLALASAAALLLVGLGSYWLYARLTRPAWEVEALAGTPRIGAQTISKDGLLGLGEWLVTDQASSARITVGEIGLVEIAPNTQVQLVTARASEHRLALKRGKLEATIWAPPKLFYVNTPSATAIDLGCAYSLEVNEAGEGLLRVKSGWVAFEWQGVESFVPAEAVCVTRPQLGPGTPHFADAAAALQRALTQFDSSQMGASQRVTALETVLAEARRRDALTLWHLLARTQADERGRVYDRLAALVAPPSEVTRAGVLGGDKAMIDAWWDKLELGSTSWWRLWKGPVPTAK
jgi:hypothetical protein